MEFDKLKTLYTLYSELLDEYPKFNTDNSFVRVKDFLVVSLADELKRQK